MANAEKRGSSSAGVWVGMAVVIALIAAGVRVLTRERVEVRVAPVTHQNLLSSVSTNGKVEPVHEFQAHAPTAGVVSRIFVNVGQHVAPGTPLVKMDDQDVQARVATANSTLMTAQVAADQMRAGGTQEERNQFTANLESAKFERDQAVKNLGSAQALQAKGAASTSEVDAAKQRVDTAELALRNAQVRMSQRYGTADQTGAKARIADARANLQAAQGSYAGANIRSPVAGTVYAIPVSEYDFVPAGEDLLNVADLNRIQVRAYFDEPEIGKLATGQVVKIVWDAKPNQTWHGHILMAPTTVIPYGTRSVGECLITVDDAKGDLLPNTNVTVTVSTAERFNTLSVPREALHTEGLSNYVYRVVDRKLVRTPVQVGLVNLTRVEVTDGLSERDTVALNATSNRDLMNGLDVKPVE